MSRIIESYQEQLTQVFPLKKQALIHCITNSITSESVANAILFMGAKPVMASDSREVKDFLKQADALFINLGHLSQEQEKSILLASDYAGKVLCPIVVDAVGVGVSSLRRCLVEELLQKEPKIVKGNFSEMRSLCGLATHARGVDGHMADQTTEAIEELREKFQEMTLGYPKTVFVATGVRDLIVSSQQHLLLQNGVFALDQVTGTGDIVGGLMAVFLAEGYSAVVSAMFAISYLNCCGEQAFTKTKGLYDFRNDLFNQLADLQKQRDWYGAIKGEVK
ncbi:hydroxyethylthiazole kinase [Granulicatella balaenopterae]|uniref:Hydroxyethylthiazole kinase n=1 Tax=Granulicatella balaenopterae TaxID=137733 RepID=A0A1H9MIQ0_9LACT|nr:hydroxyethylthiazole kinase [Granulicatella balaenopterae]SER23421.1 hydroxyethylthiazole kinase [Granulicatella balaenopterae]